MTSPYRSSASASPSRAALSSNAPTNVTPVGASSQTSALRPRNRHLISTELTSPGPGARAASENRNRDVSPIPSRHPSRITTTRLRAEDLPRPVGGLLVPGQEAGLSGVYGRASPKNAGFGKGIWDSGWTGSWTALQGLASSVLGGEVGDGSEGYGSGLGRKDGDAGRKRVRANSAAKKPTASWGPSGLLRRTDDGIGAGSSAARDTAVKERKTASILESHEGVNGGLDVNGNYKSRNSFERPNTSGGEEEALVYVHHVQPQDSQAGVVLKYNCPLEVFRKANRLWPNDVLQVRKVVLLPIDSCAIKGIPCNPPTDSQPIDLLAPTPELEDSPTSPTYINGATWSHNPQNIDTKTSSSYDIPDVGKSKTEEQEQPWVHVRWVLLDSSPSAKPVEIARLPRKALGYFPPRRRKSHTTFSSLSSPRGSSDLPSIQEPSDTTIGTQGHSSSSTGSRSNIGSYFPAPTSNPHSRSGSVRDAAAPPSWMRGSGGVGKLANHVRPGPGEDSLHNWATKYVPILGTGHLPSSSAAGPDTVSFGFNDELASLADVRSFPSAAGSGAAMPVGHGSGLGLENAAAAIEGWVRRLAVKAAPGTPRLGMGISAKAPPELGDGDLIELLDGAGSDDGRGFEPSTTSTSRSDAGITAREDLPAGLRGRAAGKGKSD